MAHAPHAHHRHAEAANPTPSPAAVGESGSGGGAWYTCPMHPEVRQLGPGHCPKCGMALEPELPGADDDAVSPELADFTRRFWWTLPLTVGVLAIEIGRASWRGRV